MLICTQKTGHMFCHSAKECFHDTVIITVSFAGHRLDDTMFCYCKLMLRANSQISFSLLIGVP